MCIKLAASTLRQYQLPTILWHNPVESPLWFTFWFSLIFNELWLVNVFFWLIHQSLISWFYYLIEYIGVWSVINHVATYQYWETLFKTQFSSSSQIRWTNSYSIITTSKCPFLLLQMSCSLQGNLQVWRPQACWTFLCRLELNNCRLIENWT